MILRTWTWKAPDVCTLSQLPIANPQPIASPLVGTWDSASASVGWGLRNLPTGTWDQRCFSCPPALGQEHCKQISSSVAGSRFQGSTWWPSASGISLPCTTPAGHSREGVCGAGFMGIRLTSLELKVIKAGTCIVLDKALVLVCLVSSSPLSTRTLNSNLRKPSATPGCPRLHAGSGHVVERRLRNLDILPP